MDAMVKSTGMWMAAMPSNGLTAGFKTFQDRAVLFGKQNAEAGFAVASELTNAKKFRIARYSEPLCTGPDAGLRSSGAGVRPADGASLAGYQSRS